MNILLENVVKTQCTIKQKIDSYFKTIYGTRNIIIMGKYRILLKCYMNKAKPDIFESVMLLVHLSSAIHYTTER